MQGIKFFADRAEDGLGFQTDPPNESVQGQVFWSPRRLASELKRAHDRGWQIAVHATGDGGLDLVLGAFERIRRSGIVDQRHRIEHLTVVRDDQIKLLKDLGLIASIQHSIFHSGATRDVIRWVGRKRVGLTGRWRDFVDAKIPITSSTDRPWAIVGTSGASLPAIEQAVTRVGPGGKQPPPWMLTQRLTVEEVLRSLTIDAAFAQGKEGTIGSIEVGKAADLVILSADPTRVLSDRLAEIEVIATFVDGRLEYCAPSAPAGLRQLCP